MGRRLLALLRGDEVPLDSAVPKAGAAQTLWIALSVYWCLASEAAPVKAESCGGCHSYLKAFYLQADHQLELVADDLASLALDAEMEAQDVARSGFNPLMLP